jgi:SAM-dependent methyltransferase
MGESKFQPHFFERQDESPDPLFYIEPRLVVHIDEYAIEAARRLYDELLPREAAILDVMSSYRSHMPDDLRPVRLVGVGMNEAEMRANPQLTEFSVMDLNADPVLPYTAAEFDGAVVTVSVQYMTKPVEIFRDVARVLEPGAPFIVTYSNRMFPTKAVRIWQALDDRERASLIALYFRESEAFDEPAMRDCTIDSGSYNDPLYAVWACKSNVS